MAEPILNTPFFDDIDDFLRWAAGREERFEFVEGRVRAMAPASDRHALIAANTSGELRARLKGTPCRVYDASFGLATRGRTRTNARSPDVTVACPDPSGGRRVVLLVEVLSPSSERDDLDVKRVEYQALPDLGHYLVLAQDIPHAVLYTRDGDGWRVEDFEGTDAAVPLAALGVVLPLAEAYAGVDFDAEP